MVRVAISDTVEGSLSGRLFLLAGLWLTLFPALSLFGAIGFFFLGVPLHGFTFLPALVLASMAVWRFGRQFGATGYLSIASGSVAGLTVFLAILVSGQLYDYSADGQSYHQEAVIQLAEGWNPVRQPDIDPGVNLSIWLNSYPKSAWINAALIYKTTGRIQTGKAFNLIFLMASVWVLYGFFVLALKVKPVNAWLFSFALSLNPVTINQLFTYYVDGITASLLLLLFVSLLMYKHEELRRVSLLLMGACMMLLNTKFTATIYVVVVIGLFSAHHLFLTRKVGQVHYYSLLFLAIALGFSGFNPYLTNWLYHGHPFYPVMGDGAIDIITAMRPAGYEGMPAINRFISSHFQWHFHSLANLKYFFASYDWREGGFGPAFLPVGVMATVLLLVALVKKQLSGGQLIGLIMFASLILLTGLINPENWWARYVPQLWLVPLLMLACLGIFSKGNIRRFSLSALMLLVSFQAVHLGATTLITYRMTQRIEKQLKEFQSYGKVIVVNPGITASVRKRLAEHKLPYCMVSKDFSNDNLKDWREIVATRSFYYLREP